MPGLFDVFHPFFADGSGFEQFNCREIREDAMNVEIAGDVSQGRYSIVGKLILVFDSHNVSFAHLELYVSLSRTVLEAVS